MKTCPDGASDAHYGGWNEETQKEIWICEGAPRKKIKINDQAKPCKASCQICGADQLAIRPIVAALFIDIRYLVSIGLQASLLQRARSSVR